MQIGKVSSVAAILLISGMVAIVYGQSDKEGKQEKGAAPQQKGAPETHRERGPEQRTPAPQPPPHRPEQEKQQTQRNSPQPPPHSPEVSPRQQQQRNPQTPSPQEKQHAQQSQPEPRRQRPAPPQQTKQSPAQEPQRARQTEPQQTQQRPGQRAQQPQQSRERVSPQPQRSQQEARTWQQQKGWLKGGGWQGRSTWQQNRSQNWNADHRTWAQRGGYGGAIVPATSFDRYFGRQHFFRIRTRPVIYLGYPRFEYAGYSFLLLDPWPAYWSDDWFDSDDLYIDYDDGYYLYNRRDPQVRLAIALLA